MTTLIGIEEEKSIILGEKLNDLLANYSIYYQNLRGFHWNIIGDKFFELHAKYEELYTLANTAIDEIAERILTLGSSPFHTFTDYLRVSDIKETSNIRSSSETLRITLENLSVLLLKEREILSIAQEANDEGTATLMSDNIKFQEKTIWMLNAFLNNRK